MYIILKSLILSPIKQNLATYTVDGDGPLVNKGYDHFSDS